MRDELLRDRQGPVLVARLNRPEARNALTPELVSPGVTDTARARPRLDAWRHLVFDSDDAKEGAQAFVEKRPPAWRGH